jgi:hypothetical protein
MTPVHLLWLPILLSAVAVFVASSLIHMVSPWHKSDYPRLSNEAAVLDALRPLAIPAGDYMMPRPVNRAELRSPEFLERMNKGPVMIMTVLPNGPMAMGSTFALWAVYLILVATLAAYVAGVSMPPGAAFWRVFRTVAVVSFVGYVLALWQMSIWYRRAWMTTLKATADGVIYALLTAGVLAWLWPR